MQLDDLLTRIKQEADRLQVETSLPAEDAYCRAITSCVRDAAEKQVTPFQDRILRTMRILSPRPDSPPVATRRLLSEIGGLENRWQAWYHLSALEEKGLVHRPNGPRSGWKVREVA